MVTNLDFSKFFSVVEMSLDKKNVRKASAAVWASLRCCVIPSLIPLPHPQGQLPLTSTQDVVSFFTLPKSFPQAVCSETLNKQGSGSPHCCRVPGACGFEKKTRRKCLVQSQATLKCLQGGFARGCCMCELLPQTPETVSVLLVSSSASMAGSESQKHQESAVPTLSGASRCSS